MSLGKLLIISHTEHYKSKQGVIVGWGSTITEINYLATIFDEIYHLGVLLKEEAPESSLPYKKGNIHFVPLKPTGGKKMIQKFDIIWNAPNTIVKVERLLNKVDFFQFRAPTGIGIYLIPFLTLLTQKKGWFKFAGNWKGDISYFYNIQRMMLKKLAQKRFITVNGEWNEKNTHILAFENPCLTQTDRTNGREVVFNKTIEERIDYCFVGGLNKNKGIDELIHVYGMLSSEKIGTLHVIGDGVLRDAIEKVAKKSRNNIKFHGFLGKDEIISVYENCHFIVLPSKSEGFPKVIGEAMNYGCIPIVSAISCIPQYIKSGYNGFLIDPLNTFNLEKELENSLILSSNDYKKYIDINYFQAEKFTYTYYLERIQKDIINNA